MIKTIILKTARIIAPLIFGVFALGLTIGAQADTVQVTMETTMGKIILEVHPDKAPLSAGDFLKYVDQHLYDGQGFYRVVRPDNDQGSPLISVIQGGLLDEDKGLAPIALETTEMTGMRHTDGAISLARGAATDSGGGAAFFITIGDNPGLDHGQNRNPDGQGFAVFGYVIEGMDVVRNINALRGKVDSEDDYTKGQILANPVIITTVRRK